jgi:rubrerythrin
MSVELCSAAIYDLIEDEAEAISGYFKFLDRYSRGLREDERETILDIIFEEKDHIEKLKKIQER